MKSESLALEGKHPYSYTKDGYTYTFNPGTKRKMTDEEYAKAAERFEYDTYRHLVATGVIKPKSLETKPDRGVKIKPLKGGREKVKPKKAYVHDPASIKLGNKVYGTKNDPNFIPKFAQDREVHIKPELRNEDLTLEEIILEELDNVLSEKCWPGYEKKGMKTMFGKRYPNCVKKSKKKKKNEEIEEGKQCALNEEGKECPVHGKKACPVEEYDISELQQMDEEGLRDWFGKSKSKDGKKGWVQVVSGKPCARQPGQKTTPKCVSSAKRASMSKKERESAQRRKRAADPNQPKKTGAAKPTYVSTDKKKKKKVKKEAKANWYEPHM